MATKSGPAPAGPLSYAYVAATIPIIPQAIRQATYKPTEVYKIIIRIGDTANRKETLN